MKRFICWALLGHRWKNFGGNYTKTLALMHLHPRAGNIDLCTRCGLVWDDFSGWVNREPEALAYYEEQMRRLAVYASAHLIPLRGNWPPKPWSISVPGERWHVRAASANKQGEEK